MTPGVAEHQGPLFLLPPFLNMTPMLAKFCAVCSLVLAFAMLQQCRRKEAQI